MELLEEPPRVVPKRRFGLSAEAHGGWNLRRASWSAPVSEKTKEQRDLTMAALRQCPFFCNIAEETLGRIADVMILEVFEPGQNIVKQGEFGRSGYVMLEGRCDVYDDSVERPRDTHQPEDIMGSAPSRGTFVRSLHSRRFFGEMTMLWGVRRTRSVYAATRCVLAKLKRDSYLGLVTRGEMLARNQREEILRRVDMFETLSDEHISQIADALERKTFEKGDQIIRQWETGKEFYVVLTGECVATVETGSDKSNLDVQEYLRYYPGDLFGEKALLHRTTRAATITALSQVEVLCLKRSKFERLLGPLDMLRERNYLSDPRKKIADFYRVGDRSGPLGSLPGPPGDKPTKWFAVYRPTSRESITKMLSGKAVGKGLNVKGKSAKKNRMSGFVPFLQISKADHKHKIEESIPSARLTIYYATEVARDIALTMLQPWVSRLHIEGPRAILKVDRYADLYGLDVPECVMRQAYIMEQDIAFLSGWETGRQSEPAFMDMNFHAVCGSSEPEVVLYQSDSENPMNPHALLIAYAESTVKPVVSDFDTFTIGSHGMLYETLPAEQQALASWVLENTEEILRTPGSSSWNSRWLEVLKSANEKGFHPNIPKYGFGDATSYRLIQAVIKATIESGAVRHGAECFNFYFPQELDDDYLVVWEGFDGKPWEYMEEDDLREFLLDRIQEGYSFPLNPVWVVRDEGWYDVYKALWANTEARIPLDAWYPPESGIAAKIEAIRRQFPDGFCKLQECAPGRAEETRISLVEDLDNCERADLLLQKAQIHSRWKSVRKRVAGITGFKSGIHASVVAAPS